MDKFSRGLILSKKFAGQTFESKIPYVQGEKIGNYQISVKDGQFELSDSYSHKFQLEIIMKSLFQMEKAVKYSSFVNGEDLKGRIGFHQDEMKYASFLASLGEVPILYVEGTYKEELQEKLGLKGGYQSMLVYLPKDASLLTEAQKDFLRELPEYIVKKEISYFEISLVSDRIDKNEYLSGLDAYATLVSLPQNSKDKGLE